MSVEPRGIFAPKANPNEAEHRRQLADSLNNAINGGLNIVGTFTIANGATSTTVSDPRATQGSFVFPFPLQVNGRNLQPYLSARATGSFTLTHTAPVGTSDFYYLLIP